MGTKMAAVMAAEVSIGLATKHGQDMAVAGDMEALMGPETVVEVGIGNWMGMGTRLDVEMDVEHRMGRAMKTEAGTNAKIHRGGTNGEEATICHRAHVLRWRICGGLGIAQRTLGRTTKCPQNLVLGGGRKPIRACDVRHEPADVM